jgi:phenylalanine-4-hydroxylase
MPARSIPKYLQRYVSKQHYEQYTARNQAAWRYIMRRSREYFKKNALPIYLEGLKQTGISPERIPRIEEMDAKLNELGWGAVAVTGFIPPAAFLDFQARRILPIATDMRPIDHINYTPSPDIVHEAAGHAPIIADPQYSEYLTKYASVAQKAIFVKEDLDVYEAIRCLSDIKSNPDALGKDIEQAEKALIDAVNSIEIVSEAAKTARMNWWTVEYGLMGSPESCLIFGAGLLSSIGESRSCLSDEVKKIPLSVGCVETAYDITEPQPQLFVAKDMQHLMSVLEEFESTLSFIRGGSYGLERALEARTVNTVELANGIQVSGKLVAFESAEGDLDQVEFLKFDGPTQISREHRELSGHGVSHHAQGFSSPIGAFKQNPSLDPNGITCDQIVSLGVVEGQNCTLEFVSGFKVQGLVAGITTHNDLVDLVTWKQCTVTKGDGVYFQPEWGDFDMILGKGVSSVFGGASDRESYGMHDVGNATTAPGRQRPHNDEELECFGLYQQVRDLREAAQKGQTNEAALSSYSDLSELVTEKFPDEWLLRLELVELGQLLESVSISEQHAQAANERSKLWDPPTQKLFAKGLTLH